MKNWLKFSITANPVLVEAIADYLLGVIGCGVEIGVDEHREMTIVTGFLDRENPDDHEKETVTTQIRGQLNDLAEIFKVDSPTFNTTLIEDEDWGKRWKEHFSPFSIVDNLVVAPTWEEYHAKKGEHVIVMDPGMAFGTGHHATTALSLELIKEVLTPCKEGKNVLDVGTGTGILGMGACLFGAGRVLGIDNDPDAVMAARENVTGNGLAAVMEVSQSSLASVNGPFFLVVANIIHDVLLQMAADLQRLTAPGGKLILSGILHGQQAENIVAVFQEYGFVSEQELQRQEWAALQLVKK